MSTSTKEAPHPTAENTPLQSVLFLGLISDAMRSFLDQHHTSSLQNRDTTAVKISNNLQLKPGDIAHILYVPKTREHPEFLFIQRVVPKDKSVRPPKAKLTKITWDKEARTITVLPMSKNPNPLPTNQRVEEEMASIKQFAQNPVTIQLATINENGIPLKYGYSENTDNFENWSLKERKIFKERERRRMVDDFLKSENLSYLIQQIVETGQTIGQELNITASERICIFSKSALNSPGDIVTILIDPDNWNTFLVEKRIPPRKNRDDDLITYRIQVDGLRILVSPLEGPATDQDKAATIRALVRFTVEAPLLDFQIETPNNGHWDLIKGKNKFNVEKPFHFPERKIPKY